ncbi:unnamed protein product [Prorocentrum cordatum]|uniref:RNA helicase n=1 Tax=Prorocentrum cordatum TaxID=2364126 RepID=A0ABN9Y284_9DINO|nr:unnamed protein product [Polarella glacialis]
MMEKSGPELMCSWVKELVALPTFDRPGAEPKSRLTFSLKGSLLLPREDATAASMLTELQNYDATKSTVMISPLETPMELFHVPGLWVPTEQIVCEALRSMGGEIKMNRAPRGNLSRQLGGGEGRGKKPTK